jgi:hypothetical protein
MFIIVSTGWPHPDECRCYLLRRRRHQLVLFQGLQQADFWEFLQRPVQLPGIASEMDEDAIIIF